MATKYKKNQISSMTITLVQFLPNVWCTMHSTRYLILWWYECLCYWHQINLDNISELNVLGTNCIEVNVSTNWKPILLDIMFQPITIEIDTWRDLFQNDASGSFHFFPEIFISDRSSMIFESDGGRSFQRTWLPNNQSNIVDISRVCVSPVYRYVKRRTMLA
jgi:hypothetical protein